MEVSFPNSWNNDDNEIKECFFTGKDLFEMKLWLIFLLVYGISCINTLLKIKEILEKRKQEYLKKVSEPSLCYFKAE